MENVGYISPFVPPEWIAAHGVSPLWLTLARRKVHTHDATRRGVCPCAGAVVANAICGAVPETLVLTTVCDQMRYAAANLETKDDISPFLLNVPSTWQSSQSRRLYREELDRLGRFLVRIGGRHPTNRQLELTIEHYDDCRTAALARRRGMSARQWAATLVDLRCDLTATPVPANSDTFGPVPNDPESDARTEETRRRFPQPMRDRVVREPENASDSDDGIPLALIGGPLLAEDDSFVELVERAGGRIVVDASEGGERTLPAIVDRLHLKSDPLDELVRIYFDTIPDVFRRPNTRLYEWLGENLAAQSVRGIIFRRYPFCDLWHAELHRLRRWSNVPVLDIDVGTSDEGESSRTLGRIEAFLEMFR